MDNRAYILDMLSRGASAADIARNLAISPTYISQLQSDADFAQELAAKRAAHAAERDSRATKVQNIHDKYLSLEERLLDTLTVQAKANLLKPIEQMKLLQVVASKKEPMQPLANPSSTQVNVVTQITLPAQIAQQFVLNANREIVGMESGQSFAPMSTENLAKLASKRALPEPKPQLQSNNDILKMFALNNINADEVKI